MKTKLASTILMVMAVASMTTAKAEVTWLNDFDGAMKEAAKRGVPVLAYFSGSDWCGWCMKLDREVLSQEAFGKYVKEAVVLFKADFPRSTSLPDKTRAQNENLARTYEVAGFPTVLVLDSSGKVLARTGYIPGGAEKYVDHLKTLIAAKGKQ